MTELIIPSEAPALSELKERKLDQIARRSIFSLLTKLKHGRITIIEDHHRYSFGEDSDTSSFQAEVTVHHSHFYSRILFGGSIGAPEELCVSLNLAKAIDTDKIHRQYTYHHPVYNPESLTARESHAQISGINRTHYAGAYWGYGFHEDGVRSSVEVCKHFNLFI